MKKSPDCLIIYDSIDKKSSVVLTSNKRVVMRAILKQLDRLETDIRIYSAYMEDTEQKKSYDSKVTYLKTIEIEPKNIVTKM